MCSPRSQGASADGLMSSKSDFRPILTSLWFRLITLGIIGFAFIEALVLAPGKAQGWSFYLTAPEVVFEVMVRLIFAALVGVAFGTICTAALAPFLWHYKSKREPHCRTGYEGCSVSCRFLRLPLRVENADYLVILMVEPRCPF